MSTALARALLVLALAGCAALAGAGTASASDAAGRLGALLPYRDGASRRPSPTRVDRGIVQSVSATAIVLKELDGNTITIAVGKSTRVLVNGRAASLSDIGPGFVAAVTYEEGKPARAIEAFGVGLPVPVSESGTVKAVSTSAIVLKGRRGVVTIPVDGATRVYVNGRPASLLDVKPGFTAVVTREGDGPAREIRATGKRSS